MARPIENDNGKRKLLRIAYETGGEVRALRAALALNITAPEARKQIAEWEAERAAKGNK